MDFSWTKCFAGIKETKGAFLAILSFIQKQETFYKMLTYTHVRNYWWIFQFYPDQMMNFIFFSDNWLTIVNIFNFSSVKWWILLFFPRTQSSNFAIFSPKFFLNSFSCNWFEKIVEFSMIVHWVSYVFSQHAEDFYNLFSMIDWWIVQVFFAQPIDEFHNILNEKVKEFWEFFSPTIEWWILWFFLHLNDEFLENKNFKCSVKKTIILQHMSHF